LSGRVSSDSALPLNASGNRPAFSSSSYCAWTSACWRLRSSDASAILSCSSGARWYCPRPLRRKYTGEPCRRSTSAARSTGPYDAPKYSAASAVYANSSAGAHSHRKSRSICCAASSACCISSLAAGFSNSISTSFARTFARRPPGNST